MPKGPIRNLEHILTQKRDAYLVSSVLKGNKKAFEILMSLYKKRIYALGKNFFKNVQDSEDYVQEVFIKAYENLSSFKGEALFSTWITRIAYNLAINAVNRRKDFLPIADETLLESKVLSPEEELIRKTTILAVQEAVKDLPEKYSICLEMYFFHDLSYKQIEEITNLPENTIKSHIFRAKKILRTKLKEVY